MLSITVYTKPACVQCTATERRLGSTPYATAEAQSPDAAALIATLGHMRAPVVTLSDRHGRIIDHWSGFNPDRIDAAARAVTGILIPVAA